MFGNLGRAVSRGLSAGGQTAAVLGIEIQKQQAQAKRDEVLNKYATDAATTERTFTKDENDKNRTHDTQLSREDNLARSLENEQSARDAEKQSQTEWDRKKPLIDKQIKQIDQELELGEYTNKQAKSIDELQTQLKAAKTPEEADLITNKIYGILGKERQQTFSTFQQTDENGLPIGTYGFDKSTGRPFKLDTSGTGQQPVSAGGVDLPDDADPFGLNAPPVDNSRPGQINNVTKDATADPVGDVKELIDGVNNDEVMNSVQNDAGALSGYKVDPGMDMNAPSPIIEGAKGAVGLIQKGANAASTGLADAATSRDADSAAAAVKEIREFMNKGRLPAKLDPQRGNYYQGVVKQALKSPDLTSKERDALMAWLQKG